MIGNKIGTIKAKSFLYLSSKAQLLVSVRFLMYLFEHHLGDTAANGVGDIDLSC